MTNQFLIPQGNQPHDDFVRFLHEQLQGIELKIDDPFIEFKGGGQGFVIECYPSGGYGLSSVIDRADPAEGYGEGSDEVFEDAAQLADRLKVLVASESNTHAATLNSLRELRVSRRVTQVEMAERLGIKQPTVSRLERQDNVEIATLRKYVMALGGHLHVSATFENTDIEVELFSTTRLREEVARRLSALLLDGARNGQTPVRLPRDLGLELLGDAELGKDEHRVLITAGPYALTSIRGIPVEWETRAR